MCTVWLGITDQMQEENWVLLSTNQNVTFFNWDTNPNQPDGTPTSEQDCGAFTYGTGKWSDYPCFEWYFTFVCQYR
jgi:hypothetical protein